MPSTGFLRTTVKMIQDEADRLDAEYAHAKECFAADATRMQDLAERLYRTLHDCVQDHSPECYGLNVDDPQPICDCGARDVMKDAADLFGPIVEPARVERPFMEPF